MKIYVIVSFGKPYDKDAADYLAGAAVQIRYAMHNKHFVIIDRNCIWNCSFDIFGSVPAEIIASIRETDDGDNNLFSV